MAETVTRGSWARKYFAIEKKTVKSKSGVDTELSFDVCKVKNPADADLTCGKAYKHSPSFGTNSMLRHLRQVHGIGRETKQEHKANHSNNLL